MTHKEANILAHKNVVWSVLLGLSAAVLLVWAINNSMIEDVEISVEPEALGGIHYNPPRHAPDFKAVNHSGQDYTFSKQPHPLKMVFFGYVSCMDVCPTNLKKFELMQEIMGEDADQVQFVFVSIDPEKETPEVMKDYLSYYSGEIIGVTGTMNQLASVYDDWGIRRERVDVDTDVDERGYKFDHTGQIFLVQGEKLRVSYPYGTSHNDMARDVQALLKDPSLGDRLPAVSEIKQIAIPAGAYTKRFQKEPTIPTYIRVRVGDALEWKNDDFMYHFVGDLRLAPGDSAIQRFEEPGEFYFGCTATPDDAIRIVVLEADESERAEL